MRKVLVVSRRVCLVLFSLLFVLSIPLVSVFSVFALGISDTDLLAERLVSESYVDAAYGAASEAFIDTALVYGVDAEVLKTALKNERAAMRACAISGTRSLLDSLKGSVEYTPAVFDSFVFETALNDYFEVLLEENPSLAVREGAIKEIASDCAQITSTACAPIGTGLFASLAGAVHGKLSGVVGSFLIPAVVFCILCVLLFGVAVFFLAEKGKRTFTLFSSLFCGSTLLFVPAFFLFSSVHLTDLALARGVLYFLIENLLGVFVAPIRVFATVLFSCSVLGLLVLLLLFLRRGLSKQPPCSDETEVNGEMMGEKSFETAQETAERPSIEDIAFSEE